MDIEDLVAYLNQHEKGEIDSTGELENLLAECWDEFIGDYGGMKPYKLIGRMENVRWDPPILTFMVERHGGTVLGSSRAEKQVWELTSIKKSLDLINLGIDKFILDNLPSMSSLSPLK